MSFAVIGRDPRPTRSARSVVRRAAPMLLDGGEDLVFVAGLQDPAARAIQQAREVGLTARFVGGDGIEGLASMGARYDEDPESQPALAYDALLARALEAGHRDPASIRAWPAGVGRDGRGSSPAFEGVAGRVQFDQNGDPVNKRFTMGVIHGGTIALAEAGR